MVYEGKWELAVTGRIENGNPAVRTYGTDEEKKATGEWEVPTNAFSKKKENGKLFFLLNLKPCGDKTNMGKLEGSVHGVEMPSLL